MYNGAMAESEPPIDLEVFWGAILSEDAGRVRRVWEGLTDEEAQAVAEHLRAMAADETRPDVQRRAAQFAIEAIRDAF